MKRFTVLVAFVSVFMSSSVNAALKWDLAAYVWVATAVLVDAASFGTATPLMLAGVASLGFHAGVVGLYWDEMVTNPNSTSPNPLGATKYLSVKLDAKVPLVTPNGWTAPVTPDLPPTPPERTPIVPGDAIYSGGYSIMGVYSRSGGVEDIRATGKTVEEVISKVVTFYNSRMNDEALAHFGTISGTVNYVEQEVGGGDLIHLFTSTGKDQTVIVRNDPGADVCPAGYLSDGNDCVLQDAKTAKAPSDKTCEIQKVGGIFIANPIDPDCSNSVIKGLGTNIISQDVDGNNIVIKALPTGETVFENTTYNDATQQSETISSRFTNQDILLEQTQSFLAGKVTPATGTSSGSGSGTGTGTGTGTSTGSSGGGSCGGPDQPACQIYLGPIPTVGEPSIDETAASAHTAASTFDVFLKDSKLSALKGFAVPAHASTCPTSEFSFNDQTFLIDAHCTLFDEHMPLFSGVMSVVWVVTGVFIILRA